MTPKQQERIRLKIKAIKAELAADKKFWGGQYHDGRGYRYMPPQFYIQINDFSGGLRYLNWFNKIFPDDSCYPIFWFEWSIILFKTGRFQDAEKKAFSCFCSNVYIFDAFLGRPVFKIEKEERSIIETVDYAITNFTYSSKQENLVDFAKWLEKFIGTDTFIQVSNKYLDIQKKLLTVSDSKTRQFLLRLESQLVNEI